MRKRRAGGFISTLNGTLDNHVCRHGETHRMGPEPDEAQEKKQQTYTLARIGHGGWGSWTTDGKDPRPLGSWQQVLYPITPLSRPLAGWDLSPSLNSCLQLHHLLGAGEGRVAGRAQRWGFWYRD